MDDHEDFYDEQIGPELLKLAQLCRERNIPFLALVQYNDGGIGATVNDVTQGPILAAKRAYDAARREQGMHMTSAIIVETKQ